MLSRKPCVAVCLAVVWASSACAFVVTPGPGVGHTRAWRSAAVTRVSMGVGAPGGGPTLAEEEYEVPAGARKLRIPMPLGIAFEEVEDGTGAVVVGFTEGSNGAKSGVKVGEKLIACRLYML